MVQLQMVSSTLTGLSVHTDNCNMENQSTACKQALLKKVKTGKYKFYVLHKNSAALSARLEYYDNEMQWAKKKKAKRTVYLRDCFSLNAFTDLTQKTKFGITLYTKDKSMKVGFDSEQTRDVWLAEMLLLKHSEKPHSPVQHVWCVRARTRGMRYPFEGNYKLCLNEEQATLISREDSASHVVELPLNTITDCHQNNNFFDLEVSHEAEGGPGEIWLELEDTLIAQNVHRAFIQNMLIVSARDTGFRPASRSLSFKDKKSAYCARVRSGSDARQCSRAGQSYSKLSQYGHTAMDYSSCDQRERSDSLGSQSTTASLSTDESDWQTCSRSTTPESQSQSNKIPEDHCKCTCGKSGSSQSNGYANMSYGQNSNSKTQDTNSNFVYVDMSGSHHLPYLESENMKNVGYIDMTVVQRSPNLRSYKSKLEPVKCYLREDESSETRSEISVNRKPPVSPQPQADTYVEMCKRKMLSDKSSSAPHLLPGATHFHHMSDPTDNFMNIDFENRNRTASLSCAHRPRISSWSQNIRPRAATADYKRRVTRQQMHNNNISNKQKVTEYIDMTCGGRGSADISEDSYVEMSLNQQSKERLASAAQNCRTGDREDKENHHPTNIRVSRIVPMGGRVPPITQPFPELCTSSSEDDVSLHSLDGSLSMHSLTSSADSMSTSSQSSSHTDPYVCWSPASANSHCRGQRTLMKPARVASYIIDDTNDRQRPKPAMTSEPIHSDYMEMSISNPTKQ